jgi:hypothetical protein
MFADDNRSVPRWIAVLMGVIALSLAVMSALHFADVLVGEKPFRPERAGTSEAVICVALAVGCAVLVRRLPRRGLVAIIAVLIAVAGFILGLTFTTRGGGTVDIAYHATVLPLLLLTLAFLIRPGALARSAHG